MLNIVEDFRYPIPLAPQQRGRYVTAHSNYLLIEGPELRLDAREIGRRCEPILQLLRH